VGAETGGGVGAAAGGGVGALELGGRYSSRLMSSARGGQSVVLPLLLAALAVSLAGLAVSLAGALGASPAGPPSLAGAPSPPGQAGGTGSARGAGSAAWVGLVIWEPFARRTSYPFLPGAVSAVPDEMFDDPMA